MFFTKAILWGTKCDTFHTYILPYTCFSKRNEKWTNEFVLRFFWRKRLYHCCRWNHLSTKIPLSFVQTSTSYRLAQCYMSPLFNRWLPLRVIFKCSNISRTGVVTIVSFRKIEIPFARLVLMGGWITIHYSPCHLKPLIKEGIPQKSSSSICHPL